MQTPRRAFEGSRGSAPAILLPCRLQGLSSFSLLSFLSSLVLYKLECICNQFNFRAGLEGHWEKVLGKGVVEL